MHGTLTLRAKWKHRRDRTFSTRHFSQDLVDQLLQWKQEEYEIVLMGNFNKDVYEDRLATRVAEDDL